MCEMALLLQEIQGGARELFDPSEEKRTLQSKRLSSDQKRGKSTSSWAKSTVDRGKATNREKGFTSDNDFLTNVSKSEKVVKSRAAAHSFGRRYPEVQKVELENIYYDVNLECVSTKRRVTSSKFGMARRGDSISSQSNKVGTSGKLLSNKVDPVICGNMTNICSPNSATDNVICKEYGTHENVPSKKKRKENVNYHQSPCSATYDHTPIAYSFPKSSRDIRIANISSIDIGDLDVETSEKKLHPHIMGACMRPQSAVKRVPHIQNESTHPPSDGNTRQDISDSPDIAARLGNLSDKMRSSSYVMHQDTKKERKNIDILKIEKGIPGPGEYNLHVAPTSGENSRQNAD